MAKYPVLGNVKTRLAKDLGDEKALEVYVQLLKKTISIASDFPGEKYIFFDSYPNPLDFIETFDFEIRFQSAGDLGNRMLQAFIDIKKENSKTIIIGSDCWELNLEDLKKALMDLDHRDIVIGPAKDGGYYLLGMKEILPEIFNLTAWSHVKVLEETIDKIKGLNLSYELLREVSDIDTMDDYKNYMV